MRCRIVAIDHIPASTDQSQQIALAYERLVAVMMQRQLMVQNYIITQGESDHEQENTANHSKSGR